MRQRKRNARDAPFVNHAACGRMVGMCGYTSVPEEGHTCSSSLSRVGGLVAQWVGRRTCGQQLAGLTAGQCAAVE